MEIATMEELKLITGIIGYNTDTLNKVLYTHWIPRPRAAGKRATKLKKTAKNSKIAK